MEDTDVHQVFFFLLSTVALLLVLTAVAVALGKRMWLGAAGFACMAATSVYWLVVFHLWIALEGEPLFDSQWAGHVTQVVNVLGWLLLVIQLLMASEQGDGRGGVTIRAQLPRARDGSRARNHS